MGLKDEAASCQAIPFARLAEVIGDERLLHHSRYATLAGRAEGHQEINQVVEDWVKGCSLEEVVRTLVENEVAVWLASPFGATLLGDFGAEVIAVEEQGKGDTSRQRPPYADSLSLWWAVEASSTRIPSREPLPLGMASR